MYPKSCSNYRGPCASVRGRPIRRDGAPIQLNEGRDSKTLIKDQSLSHEGFRWGLITTCADAYINHYSFLLNLSEGLFNIA